MGFLFCNFLERNMARKNRKGIVFVSQSVELAEGVQPAEAYLLDNGSNTKVLGLLTVDEKVDGEKIDLIGELPVELQHTEENPIIMVGTKKFKVFKGIPTRIKYIPVKDGVLVTLIQGYISVEDGEGNMIPLSRNCDALSYDDGHVFTASEVESMNLLEDKESGVKYSDYVVSDCIIKLEVSKDNRNLKSIKFNKDSFIYLHKEVFEEGKTRKEAEAKAKEEARLRRAEEIAEFNRRREEEAKIKPETKKTSSGTKAPRSKKKEDDVVEGSSGAQSFLAFVEGLKK